MKRLAPLSLLILCAPYAAHAEALSELPREEAVGECYVEISNAERFETITEQVLVEEETYEMRSIPAVYETSTQRHLVKDASTDYKAIPASYKTVMETVKFAHGVEKTYAKQILVEPAQLIEVEIPAEYEEIEVSILVMPERQERVHIPAKYETVERTIPIGGTSEWHRVLCSTNSTHEHIEAIQRALTKAGYFASADGVFGPQTLAAMEAYQVANDLPVGFLTVSTVRHLGVEFN